jgi:hypothetical protein
MGALKLDPALLRQILDGDLRPNPFIAVVGGAPPRRSQSFTFDAREISFQRGADGVWALP